MYDLFACFKTTQQRDGKKRGMMSEKTPAIKVLSCEFSTGAQSEGKILGF